MANPVATTLKALVRDDQIRFVKTEAPQLDLFATKRAATQLQVLGLLSEPAAPKSMVYAGHERKFGDHVYRLVWEDEHGLATLIGKHSDLQDAVDGIKGVPCSERQVRQTYRDMIDARTVARAGGYVGVTR